MNKRKIFILALVLLTVLFSSLSFYFYQVVNAPNILVNQPDRFIHIPAGSSFSDVQSIVYEGRYVNDLLSFSFLAKLMKYDRLIKPGRYLLKSNISNKSAIRLLRSGEQSPVNITFNNVRLLEDLPAKICINLELRKEELAPLLNDSAIIVGYGFNPDNYKCMFIPNTYQVFWTIKGNQLIDRMNNEYKRFWNEDRKSLADSIGLTAIEVSILASIVQAECSQTQEASTIAGLYINRLEKGYPLQADPTVVYANGDFAIKRVLDKHKEIESPYNTYKNRGLPPGPINLPEIIYIDAVLKYEKHKYLYMCAKEDFSGYHNFATNLIDHNINARQYQNALNRARIFR
ncbi:endolytic transglycosylase MltG [Bacteroidota bacterium]